MAKINWNKDKIRRQMQLAPYPFKMRLVTVDEDFWRAWRKDKKMMRDAGYVVRKTEEGWRVYIREDDMYKQDITNFR